MAHESDGQEGAGHTFRLTPHGGQWYSYVMASKGWGYAIDYDTAIAEDLLWLGKIEHMIALGITKPEKYAAYYMDLKTLALLDLAVATTLGLSDEDCRLLRAYTEYALGDTMTVTVADLPTDWYSLGSAVAIRLDSIWHGDLPTAAQLKKDRTAYKTSLARHRRHKEQYA